MTHQELVDFFNFAGLQYSEDPESIQLLKKQLLLELKATSDDSLVIAGKRYGKNDLITLFDSNLSDTTSWNPQAMKDEYPSLNDFLNSKAYVSPMAFPKSIVSHPDFHAYSAAEIQPRFGEFLRMVQLNLKEHELRSVASAVQFLLFFTPEQQFKIATDLKLIVRNALAKVKAALLKGGRISKSMQEAEYFVNHNYYEILLKIAGDDLDFLMEQLSVGEDVMKNKRNAFDSLRFYRFQLLLPFPEEVIVVLKKNERITNQANAKESSSDSPGAGRIIWILIVAIVMVLRLATKCNRSEPKMDDSLLRMLQEQQQRRQLQEDSYYEQLNAEDSLFEQAQPITVPSPLNTPEQEPPTPEEVVPEVISAPDTLQ